MGRILCIDNSETIRKIVRDCVEDLGYVCFEAENGAVALDQVDDLDPLDMIVLDWNMPVMSGRETLARLRQHDKTKDVIILVLIKIENKDQVMEAVELGATNYMLKPFGVNSLQDKIEELMTNAV